jgi:hypothetical protein
VIARWRARLPRLDATRLADHNHYTVMISTREAAQVAATLKDLLDGSGERRTERGLTCGQRPEPVRDQWLPAPRPTKISGYLP